MITSKLLKGTDDLTDALIIRRKVFIEEQGISASLELDSFDQSSDHLVVYDNNKPVGTGRLVFREGEYSITRVAVLKESRFKGIGNIAVKHLIDLAFNYGAEEIRIHAQKAVEDFYLKLGFMPYGSVYQEAGIDHISMVLTRNTNYDV